MCQIGMTSRKAGGGNVEASGARGGAGNQGRLKTFQGLVIRI